MTQNLTEKQQEDLLTGRTKIKWKRAQGHSSTIDGKAYKTQIGKVSVSVFDMFTDAGEYLIRASVNQPGIGSSFFLGGDFETFAQAKAAVSDGIENVIYFHDARGQNCGCVA